MKRSQFKHPRVLIASKIIKIQEDSKCHRNKRKTMNRSICKIEKKEVKKDKIQVQRKIKVEKSKNSSNNISNSRRDLHRNQVPKSVEEVTQMIEGSHNLIWMNSMII
jgi:hypothetical protein